MKNSKLNRPFSLLNNGWLASVALIVLLNLGFTAPSFAQPANDDCSGAIALPIGLPAGCAGCAATGCTIGNNFGATASAITDTPTCWFSAADQDVWYSITPTVSGTYTISSDNGINDLGTDVQMALYSSCTISSVMECNDDNTECDNVVSNTLSSRITVSLTANTTYYLRVDVYDIGVEGSFCLNVVQNVRPGNDCLGDAVADAAWSIDDEINGIDACTHFTCTPYIFNPHDNCVDGDEPKKDGVTGYPVNGGNCNGQPVGEGFYQGVWFTFTSTGPSDNPVYVSAYPNNGDVFYVMTLMEDNAIANTYDCATGAIAGWNWRDCSAGDLSPLPNTTGGVRDAAKGSMQNHPRLDISGLAAGNYAILVHQYARINGDTSNTAGVAKPSDGYFNLCIEEIAPSIKGSDVCSTAEDISCLDAAAPRHVDNGYDCESLAGAHGNIWTAEDGNANAAPVANEPLHFAGIGTTDRNCTDTTADDLLTVVEQRNHNSVIYKFTIDTCLAFTQESVSILDEIQQLVDDLCPLISIINFPNIGDTTNLPPDAVCDLIDSLLEVLITTLDVTVIQTLDGVLDDVCLLVPAACPITGAIQTLLTGVVTIPVPCEGMTYFTFDNLKSKGVNGGSINFHVMKNCEGGDTEVSGFSSSCDTCDRVGPAPFVIGQGSLPAGDYYLVVNGAQGQLASYDLGINIHYMNSLLGEIPTIQDCGSYGARVATAASTPVQALTLGYVRPVPAVNFFDIAFKAPVSGNGTLEIYDVTGKLMHSAVVATKAGLNFERVDVSSLKAGVYMINLTLNGERIQSKFVKID